MFIVFLLLFLFLPVFAAGVIFVNERIAERDAYKTSAWIRWRKTRKALLNVAR